MEITITIILFSTESSSSSTTVTYLTIGRTFYSLEKTHTLEWIDYKRTPRRNLPIMTQILIHC